MNSRITVQHISESDKYAVYDTLMPKIILANKAEVGMAVNEIEKWSLPEKNIEDAYLSSEGCITSIYVILSDFCNLSCDYCFAHENISSGNMFMVVAKAFVYKLKEYIIRKCIETEIRITFYGGEPLVNIDIAIFIMKQLEEFSNIKYQLVTNGTLLTAEIVQKIRPYSMLIGVSLDGYEELHNLHRKYINGEKTFSDVMKAVNLLLASGVNVSLSITLTNEIIINKVFFFEWIDKFPVKQITFNLLRCVFDSEDKAISYYAKAANFLCDFYDSFAKKDIFEYNIFNRLKCLYNNNLLYAECSAASANQITIDTKGNIYTCQIDRTGRSLLGNIKEDNLLDISLKLNKKNIPLFDQRCKGCYALPVCGGGCYLQTARVVQNNHSKMRNDRYICEFSKRIMDYALQRLDKISELDL